MHIPFNAKGVQNDTGHHKIMNRNQRIEVYQSSAYRASHLWFFSKTVLLWMIFCYNQ